MINRMGMTITALAVIVIPILLIMSNTVSGQLVYAQNATLVNNIKNMTNVKIQGNNYQINWVDNTNAKVLSIVPQKEVAVQTCHNH